MVEIRTTLTSALCGFSTTFMKCLDSPKKSPPPQISTGINPALSYTQPQGIPDTETPVPVINLKDGTRLAGDDAPKRKDLEKWLKEHPGYVEDLGAFIPVGDTL